MNKGTVQRGIAEEVGVLETLIESINCPRITKEGIKGISCNHFRREGVYATAYQCQKSGYKSVKVVKKLLQDLR